jgi:hypothetical protein
LYRLALTLGDFQQMPSWVLRWLSFKVDSFSGESMDLAETFLLDRTGAWVAWVFFLF